MTWEWPFDGRPFDISGPAPTPADIANRALKGLPADAGRRRLWADTPRGGIQTLPPPEWADVAELSSSDLYDLAEARRMQEQHEAEQRTAAAADVFDWAALRAWLPAGHHDKTVGVPDKPTIGAYLRARDEVHA